MSVEYLSLPNIIAPPITVTTTNPYNDYIQKIRERNEAPGFVKDPEQVYHRHHIIPRWCEGSDDESNLVLVTWGEHVEAHRILAEVTRRPQDQFAYLMMSGKTAEAELARRAIMSTPEVRTKISNAQKGKIRSQEHCDNLSKSLTGKQQTPEHTAAMMRTRKIRQAELGNDYVWRSIPEEQREYILSTLFAGRARRWENTPMDIRREQSKKMNAIQKEKGSYQKGLDAARAKNLGSKVPRELVERRNAAQKAYYQTPEGQATIARRAAAHSETSRKKREAKLAAEKSKSAQISLDDH